MSMLEEIGEGLWVADSGHAGRNVCISFGIHGNERPPIDAGLELVASLRRAEVAPARGRLLLVHANRRASEQDERWSKDGVDLNRCFHEGVLARKPVLYEEARAREIVDFLETQGAEVLVDFHCTVEPAERFLMQHPPISDTAHAAVYSLLSARVLLSDPELNFGAVSLDEHMSTRGRVGICYETGWIQDPENSPQFVLSEMTNVLAGTGLFEDAPARRYEDKDLLELDAVVRVQKADFTWCDGIGVNLQALPEGTLLGSYRDGGEERLPFDATLIFPKKHPELVELGQPLVYLGRVK